MDRRRLGRNMRRGEASFPKQAMTTQQILTTRGSPADMQLQVYLESENNTTVMPEFKTTDRSREITALKLEGSLDSLKNVS
jgi:hypothetical protein